MNSDGLQVYRRLLQFVRPYRGRIALSMVASLGVALSDVATAKLVQPFIDRLVVAQEFGLVRIVPFLVVGLAVFKGGSRYLQEYFIRTSGQLVMQDIRNRFQSHTIGLSMRFFSRNSTGTLMSRALNDVGVMQSSVSEVVVTLFREGMTLIGLVAMAFYSDWKLAGMAFVVLPAAAYPAALIGKRIKNYSRQGQGAMGELTSALEQGYSGIMVIKSFGT
jgi:subfamily B ATP-binding cassette protein MsbA